MPTYNDDDGYFEVVVEREGGQTEPVYLDLHEAYSTHLQFCEEHQTDAALGAAWTTWLAQKGIDLSHLNAFRLAQDVIAAVQAFKKKHGMDHLPPTDSSGSSASPSAS